METSKRSHEAPMTFNGVIWKGVSMPEVKEPIRVWQQHVNAKSFAPNDKLVRAGMNNHGFQTVDMLFYFGKSVFACNRWNHGKLKTQVWCTTGKFTMGKAIYRGVCNRTYGSQHVFCWRGQHADVVEESYEIFENFERNCVCCGLVF